MLTLTYRSTVVFFQSCEIWLIYLSISAEVIDCIKIFLSIYRKLLCAILKWNGADSNTCAKPFLSISCSIIIKKIEMSSIFPASLTSGDFILRQTVSCKLWTYIRRNDPTYVIFLLAWCQALAFLRKSINCKTSCFTSRPLRHYSDVIMSEMASQITSFSIVCSTVCPGENQRKHHSSASLAFVSGIHRWPLKSPHKGSVTRKMFPFDDVIMANCEIPGYRGQ